MPTAHTGLATSPCSLIYTNRSFDSCVYIGILGSLGHGMGSTKHVLLNSAYKYNATCEALAYGGEISRSGYPNPLTPTTQIDTCSHGGCAKRRTVHGDARTVPTGLATSPGSLIYWGGFNEARILDFCLHMYNATCDLLAHSKIRLPSGARRLVTIYASCGWHIYIVPNDLLRNPQDDSYKEFLKPQSNNVRFLPRVLCTAGTTGATGTTACTSGTTGEAAPSA